MILPHQNQVPHPDSDQGLCECWAAEGWWSLLGGGEGVQGLLVENGVVVSALWRQPGLKSV